MSSVPGPSKGHALKSTLCSIASHDVGEYGPEIMRFMHELEVGLRDFIIDFQGQDTPCTIHHRVATRNYVEDAQDAHYLVD